MSTRANEPAYPVVDQTGERFQNEPGLTIREHFAGLAMQGLLVASDPHDTSSPATVAEWSVSYADALISALALPTPEV